MSSRIPLLIGVGLALFAGSCVSQQVPLSDPALVWNAYETPEEGLKLAYGAPASDNVLLMMTCRPGEGVVRISTMAHPGTQAIVLASGKRQSRIAADGEPTPLDSRTYLEGQAPAADPALSGFARSGKLVLVQNDRRLAVDATSKERREVNGFFQACQA